MMKKNINLLSPDRYYHLFNRGINKESIFKTENNNNYFLQILFQHSKSVADVYCYSLLQNHFHILIKTKTEDEIRNNFTEEKYLIKKSELLISKQFSNLFNAYAQAFNKMYNRTGGLFEEPFRRKEILSDEQLTETILYIHLNPLKHKLQFNYMEYKFSSFQSILQNSNPNMNAQKVIQWFGNKQDYIKAHELKSIKFL